MNPTGNEDLDVVLRLLEARKQARAERWVVARWVIRLEYYETKERAREVLARLPVSRRAGLVDRETGDTRASKPSYRAVMAALRMEGKAPERFRRQGKLGPIKPRRRKRGRSDRER